MWTCNYCAANKDVQEENYNRSYIQYHEVDQNSFINSDLGQTATDNETFIIYNDIRNDNPLQSTLKPGEFPELLDSASYLAQNMPPLSPVMLRRKNRSLELSGKKSGTLSFCGFDSESVELNYSFSQLFTSSEEDSSQLIPDLSKIEVIVPPLEAYEYQQYESLLPENELPTNVAGLGEVSNIPYRIVENATSRGGPRLIDSDGYSFTRHKPNSKTITWRCSIRNKKVTCRATVIQSSDSVFHNGPSEHCHSAPLLAYESAKIVSEVKSLALQYPQESAGRITQKAMVEYYSPDSPAEGMLNPNNVAKNANYLRRLNRPKDPHSLEFEIEDLKIPAEFLKADVRINSSRHLIFASNHMINILSKAKNWFVDSTFKITANPGMPFNQLFSIHAFIASQKDSFAKQVPLAFVLMSGRNAADYTAVLENIISLLGNAMVSSVTMDFEAAMWVAFKRVLPHVTRHGCLFHWNQAIYRHIQQLGLAVDYVSNETVRNFCRNLMALPFLPPSHIPFVFEKIEDATKKAAQVFRDLISYMKNTWFESLHWTPNSWSVFNRAIRTNNDLEGWHNRLNLGSGNRNLGFHMVIYLLEEESKAISLQTKLISYELLKRSQKKIYLELNNKIFEKWESYENGELSPMQLIGYISKLNGI